MGFLLIVFRNPKTFKTQFSTLLYCVHVTALKQRFLRIEKKEREWIFVYLNVIVIFWNASK